MNMPCIVTIKTCILLPEYVYDENTREPLI